MSCVFLRIVYGLWCGMAGNVSLALRGQKRDTYDHVKAVVDCSPTQARWRKAVVRSSALAAFMGKVRCVGTIFLEKTY